MADVPQLATCSYAAYQRSMGTAVRITLGKPRWIRLPDPRYTESAQLPYLSELAPRPHYFHAAPDVFDRKYVAQLEKHAALIEEKLTWIPVENGRLVLLCFERNVAGPQDCHRRVFAEWAQQRWSIEIPELDGKTPQKPKRKAAPKATGKSTENPPLFD